MHHPLIQPVPITLDKPRSLVLDFNARCRIEEAINVDMIADEIRFDMRTTRAMLWSALLHEDPKLTLEQVGRMITTGPGGNLEAVFKAVTEALKRSQVPEPDVKTIEGEVASVPTAAGQIAETPSAASGPAPSSTSA